MIIRRKNKENLINNLQENIEVNNLQEEDSQNFVEEFEDVDITNIEFKERLERRRGDRRRGYRRIDERTLVSRAQEEAQSIKEIAKNEGYSKGLEEARKDIENLKNSLFDFMQSKNQIYNNFSNDILDIALAISEKIIKKEVELDQSVLKNVIEEVLDKVNSDEQKIKLKVSPDDIENVKQFLPNLLAKSGIQAKISIIADDNVQTGSCILMASNGVVDANFETQIKIIKEAFKKDNIEEN